MWNTRTYECTMAMHVAANGVFGLAVAHSVFTCKTEARITVVEPARYIPDPENPSNIIQIPPRTRRIAPLETIDDAIIVSSLDTRARMWNPSTGKLIRSFGHGARVLDLRVSGKSLITSSDDHLVRFWDIDTQECRKKVAFNAPVLAMDTVGNAVICASANNDISVMHSHTGALISVVRVDEPVDIMRAHGDVIVIVHTSRVTLWQLC